MKLQSQIQELTNQGKKPKEVAGLLGISRMSVYYWLYPEYRNKLIKRSKDNFNKMPKEKREEYNKSRREYNKQYIKKRYAEDLEFREKVKERARLRGKK